MICVWPNTLLAMGNRLPRDGVEVVMMAGVQLPRPQFGDTSGALQTPSDKLSSGTSLVIVLELCQ